jgi:hypothetical protein
MKGGRAEEKRLLNLRGKRIKTPESDVFMDQVISVGSAKQ